MSDDDEIAPASPPHYHPSETSPLLDKDAGADDRASGNGTLKPSSSTTSISTGEVAEDTTPKGRDDEDGDAEPAAAEPQGMPEHIRKRLHYLVPAIGIGIFLCALDQLLVVAIYAKIGSDLDALNMTGWIATAYYLTLTSFQPLYGKLSDIFGRKECLLTAYVIFAIGNAACGFSRNMGELIAGRAVAGIGGGGMNAVVSIMLSDLVPLRDRGIWQGYLNIIFAAGTSTGGPLGGLFADSIGWRWSFLSQVPLCVVAFIAVYFVLDLPTRDTTHWVKKLGRIDFLGAFFLIAAVTSLLVGLDNGSNLGWGDPATVVPLAVSPALAAVFLLVETRVASHPFAPGHIIFDRALFACYLSNFFSIAGQMPILFFLPLLYQAVDGLSAVQSGALLIPGSISGVAASVAGGWYIRRTGRYYGITVASYGLLLFSSVFLVMFSGGVANWIPGTEIGLVLGMYGAGSGITTTLIGLLSNAKKDDMAVVVACSYLFRSLGTAIGISVQSAVMQQVLRTQLAARLAGAGIGAGDAAEIGERVRLSLDYLRELEPALAAVVRRCYQVASVSVFGANAAFLVLAFGAALFIREKRVA